MFVVAEQMLCQVEQCTQLTKRHAVHVHLASVVLNTEKHPTAVGGNVATLLDYMEYTGKNHLRRRQKQTVCSGCNKSDEHVTNQPNDCLRHGHEFRQVRILCYS